MAVELGGADLVVADTTDDGVAAGGAAGVVGDVTAPEEQLLTPIAMSAIGNTRMAFKAIGLPTRM